MKLDNISVVPYNKVLLKRYQAHINVEWSNQAVSIKYLFKYMNKGPERASVALIGNNATAANGDTRDKIKEYYDCRYISACEASWRIFGYDVHYRTPAVMRLPFHLPGQQNVVYCDNDDLKDVLDKPSVASSMFLSWMECNNKYHQARKLTYIEFLTKFVWKLDNQCWEPRKKGFSIGRIHSVPPALGEAFFFRILLNQVKGPKSFDELRTVNGRECPTFRDACYELGFLDNDREYIQSIRDASRSCFGSYLRTLFAIILMSNTLSRPDFVWENTREYLADGIISKQRRLLRTPDLIINLTLFEIEKVLLNNNSTLRNFSGMPYPDDEYISAANNCFITDELSYDRSNLRKEIDQLFASLTNEQRLIFEEISMAVEKNKGGVFFVYGYGGTGKTFLWKTLSATIRSKGQIVLNVASNGIASLLLSGGRTTHSRFLIPLVLNEDSLCHIKPGSDVADLLKRASLIIWDEAPMVHKHAFAALDRSMKDILRSNNHNHSELMFGGKVMVFGGDYRQILPVIPYGSRQNVLNASLSSSYIWSNFKVLKLTKNIRLSVGSEMSDFEQTKLLAKWLLDVGEGKVGGLNDGETIIDIPEDLLITDSVESLYSVEVLNGLKGSGLLNHKLVLKVGIPLMLLRNINHRSGLCNGTRLQVISMGHRVIEAKIISSSNIGKCTFIPRMMLTPSDMRIPFKLNRRQFPLAVCFAMTINKSRGQSLSKVGLYLRQPIFTHGQLYVALSRVRSRDGLKILIVDKDFRVTNKTSNVVFKEVFRDL